MSVQHLRTVHPKNNSPIFVSLCLLQKNINIETGKIQDYLLLYKILIPLLANGKIHTEIHFVLQNKSNIILYKNFYFCSLPS